MVAPTWWSLADDQGNLVSRADPAYVRQAHHLGYRVWPVVNNAVGTGASRRFDPDLARAVLSDAKRRDHLVQQIVAVALTHGVDGVNLDFENLHPDDRDSLTLLTQQLAPLARNARLSLSIDVALAPAASLGGSPHYDLGALSGSVDYVVLMAYDEHPTGSPVAGPVASLPWVEAGLLGVLEEVPAERLLLGIPFYTHLWREEHRPAAGRRPTSSVLGMAEVETWLGQTQAARQWDSRSRQHYAEHREADVTYRVWIEDETSVAARAQMAVRHGLAGVAAWRRGYERESIWEVIRAVLARSPSAGR